MNPRNFAEFTSLVNDIDSSISAEKYEAAQEQIKLFIAEVNSSSALYMMEKDKLRSIAYSRKAYISSNKTDAETALAYDNTNVYAYKVLAKLNFTSLIENVKNYIKFLANANISLIEMDEKLFSTLSELPIEQIENILIEMKGWKEYNYFYQFIISPVSLFHHTYFHRLRSVKFKPIASFDCLDNIKKDFQLERYVQAVKTISDFLNQNPRIKYLHPEKDSKLRENLLKAYNLRAYAYAMADQTEYAVDDLLTILNTDKNYQIKFNFEENKNEYLTFLACINHCKDIYKNNGDERYKKVLENLYIEKARSLVKSNVISQAKYYSQQAIELNPISVDAHEIRAYTIAYENSKKNQITSLDFEYINKHFLQRIEVDDKKTLSDYVAEIKVNPTQSWSAWINIAMIKFSTDDNIIPALELFNVAINNMLNEVSLDSEKEDLFLEVLDQINLNQFKYPEFSRAAKVILRAAIKDEPPSLYCKLFTSYNFPLLKCDYEIQSDLDSKKRLHIDDFMQIVTTSLNNNKKNMIRYLSLTIKREQNKKNENSNFLNDLYIQRSNYYLEIGETEKGLNDLNKVKHFKDEIRYSEICLRRAEGYIKLEKYNDALNEIHYLEDKNICMPIELIHKSYFLKGKALFGQQKFHEALEIMSKLTISSHTTESVYVLSMSFYYLNELPEAVNTYMQILLRDFEALHKKDMDKAIQDKLSNWLNKSLEEIRYLPIRLKIEIFKEILDSKSKIGSMLSANFPEMKDKISRELLFYYTKLARYSYKQKDYGLTHAYAQVAIDYGKKSDQQHYLHELKDIYYVNALAYLQQGFPDEAVSEYVKFLLLEIKEIREIKDKQSKILENIKFITNNDLAILLLKSISTNVDLKKIFSNYKKDDITVLLTVKNKEQRRDDWFNNVDLNDNVNENVIKFNDIKSRVHSKTSSLEVELENLNNLVSNIIENDSIDNQYLYIRCLGLRSFINSKLNKFQDAIADATKIISESRIKIEKTEMCTAYCNRASAYLKLKESNLDLAYSDATAAITHDKELHLAYFIRGKILFAQGRYNDAIADFEVVKKSNKKYFSKEKVNDKQEACIFSAHANMKLKKMPAALSDYTQALWIELEKPVSASQYDRFEKFIEQVPTEIVVDLLSAALDKETPLGKLFAKIKKSQHEKLKFSLLNKYLEKIKNEFERQENLSAITTANRAIQFSRKYNDLICDNILSKILDYKHLANLKLNNIDAAVEDFSHKLLLDSKNISNKFDRLNFILDKIEEIKNEKFAVALLYSALNRNSLLGKQFPDSTLNNQFFYLPFNNNTRKRLVKLYIFKEKRLKLGEKIKKDLAEISMSQVNMANENNYSEVKIPNENCPLVKVNDVWVTAEDAMLLAQPMPIKLAETEEKILESNIYPEVNVNEIQHELILDLQKTLMANMEKYEAELKESASKMEEEKSLLKSAEVKSKDEDTLIKFDDNTWVTHSNVLSAESIFVVKSSPTENELTKTMLEIQKGIDEENKKKDELNKKSKNEVESHSANSAVHRVGVFAQETKSVPKSSSKNNLSQEKVVNQTDNLLEQLKNLSVVTDDLEEKVEESIEEKIEINTPQLA